MVARLKQRHYLPDECCGGNLTRQAKNGCILVPIPAVGRSKKSSYPIFNGRWKQAMRVVCRVLGLSAWRSGVKAYDDRVWQARIRNSLRITLTPRISSAIQPMQRGLDCHANVCRASKSCQKKYSVSGGLRCCSPVGILCPGFSARPLAVWRMPVGDLGRGILSLSHRDAISSGLPL